MTKEVLDMLGWNKIRPKYNHFAECGSYFQIYQSKENTYHIYLNLVDSYEENLKLESNSLEEAELLVEKLCKVYNMGYKKNTDARIMFYQAAIQEQKKQEGLFSKLLGFFKN